MPEPDPTDLDVAELAARLVPGSRPPHPLAEGLESRAFGIDAGAERYVLRIGVGRTSFDKDAYAAAAFGGPGLPIPAVETVGTAGAFAYCLSRRLPGTPVNQLGAAALPPVIAALGETLRVVWAQDVGDSTGFGMFDGTGNARYPSWHAYLVDAAPAGAAAARGVRASLVERLHRLVVERAPDRPPTRSLLHGDFGSGNVLTDGRAVTGVLDWGLAGYGDHLHDVAEILQWEGGEPGMTALARHLRRSLPDDPDTWRRIDCYRARICVGELAWGPEATLDWMTGVATSLVDPPA